MIINWSQPIFLRLENLETWEVERFTSCLRASKMIKSFPAPLIFVKGIFCIIVCSSSLVIVTHTSGASPSASRHL